LIYLDQAATSFQKPNSVADAMTWALSNCASVGRGGYSSAMTAAETVYAARVAASDFFDTRPDQVVFTHNATHGLNIAIRSLVQPNDHVVISGFEHNAVVRPLHRIGASVSVAGTRLFDPEDTIASFSALLRPDTKAVICSHVSNVFGYILPIEQIAELCYNRGIPLIVDASQSAGVLPISLQKLHAAFIAMPGHKGLYGPQGTGILLCGILPEPLICGGTGSQSLEPDMPDYLPDIGEAGTLNVTGIAGLLAGIRYVKQTGIDPVRAHEQNLLEIVCRNLCADQQFCVYTANCNTQTGVLSFYLQDTDCEILADQLSLSGIAVRAGLQCAPLAHHTAGTLQTGTIRVSFSAFNTEQETEVFLKTLYDIVSH